MRGPGRVMGILLLTLLLAGMAVALNQYADNQAEEILANAPERETEPAEFQEADELDEEEVDPECAKAQSEYDEKWDQSVEEPDNLEAEEALEVELTELIAACES